MIFTIAFLPEAEDEFCEAFLWYSERSPLAADAFRDEFFQAIDGLSETAGDWPKDEAGTHRYHLKHFPYTVMYEMAGTHVTVMAIAHQRRRPRYWQQR